MDTPYSPTIIALCVVMRFQFWRTGGREIGRPSGEGGDRQAEFCVGRGVWSCCPSCSICEVSSRWDTPNVIWLMSFFRVDLISERPSRRNAGLHSPRVAFRYWFAFDQPFAWVLVCGIGPCFTKVRSGWGSCGVWEIELRWGGDVLLSLVRSWFICWLFCCRKCEQI